MVKRILVTGGAGYVGSVLTKKLLQRGYFVRVLDLFLYEKEPFQDLTNEEFRRLEILKGDIRKHGFCEFGSMDIDTVIHLACISNDPSFDLDPRLGKSINLDSFEPFVATCKRNGVERFINASSSSVYGISEDAQVTEKSATKPLTDYSKFKLQTEKILERYEDPHFTTCSVRSATVCGYSPRQRLDVIVNILTNHAYNKSEIKVFGGDQLRPNIHIEDLTDLYVKLVECDSKKITGEVFNYGAQNFSVTQLAMLVKEAMPERRIKMEYVATDDPRSYHINSDKIAKALGMEPKRTIQSAVRDLIKAFDDRRIPDPIRNSKYYNVRKLKEITLT